MGRGRVRGEGGRGGKGWRGRGGVGSEGRERGISVSEVVSPPYTNSVWWPSLLSTSCRSILMCTVVWWRGVLWRQKSACQQ